MSKFRLLKYIPIEGDGALDVMKKSAEKKVPLKTKLTVASKGKNDPKVILTVGKFKGSGYSLTNKSDGAYIAVAAKRSRPARQ